MRSTPTFRASTLPVLVVPLALAVMLSGCTLLGLGAAAGGVLGGCALLDENEDDRVTQEEFAAGLFNAWDTNDNGSLSRSEFARGVGSRDIYGDWSEHFDHWDTNNDDVLSGNEFGDGVAADARTASWLDRRCDDLGL